MSSTKSAKRRSAADWSALVEACERSGLSRREFAKIEGLHRGTFAFWASRLAPKQSGKPPAAIAPPSSPFVPVRVRNTEERDAGATATLARSMTPVADKIEIVLTNGCRVRCQLSQVEDPRLAALLALAEGVC